MLEFLELPCEFSGLSVQSPLLGGFQCLAFQGLFKYLYGALNRQCMAPTGIVLSVVGMEECTCMEPTQWHATPSTALLCCAYDHEAVRVAYAARLIASSAWPPHTGSMQYGLQLLGLNAINATSVLCSGSSTQVAWSQCNGSWRCAS